MLILSIDVGVEQLGFCVCQIPDVSGKRLSARSLRDFPRPFKIRTVSIAADTQIGIVRRIGKTFGCYDLTNIGEVWIEDQPGRFNKAMQRIQHFLEFYFMSRGLPVEIVSSAARMRKIAAALGRNPDLSTRYKRKAEAFLCCNILLTGDAEWEKYGDHNSADAYLQVIWRLMKLGASFRWE